MISLGMQRVLNIKTSGFGKPFAKNEKKYKKPLAIVTSLTSIIIVTIMFVYGFDYWFVAYERNWTSDTVTAVPLKFPYAALPIGFGLFLNQLIADFLLMMTGREAPFDKGEQ